MKDSICIKGVTFKRINEDLFKEIDPNTILFFMISQSGLVDRRGTIYIFTKSAAFFMDREDYGDGFIDRLLLSVEEWDLINVYFCDLLIIDPKIYNTFARELCARNIRDFWFETATCVYRDKYIE
ncbi:MAG: hypothetical protein J6W08_02520 [Alphaproteobacteria bacterium]|nr:hypothetical protein [Alphaproteobacteria bacterium]MBR0212255.1 hypothetical protein [Alphaproteobacteria bacterium]